MPQSTITFRIPDDEAEDVLVIQLAITRNESEYELACQKNRRLNHNISLI
ncbi:hypothetical protein [Enterococcus faecalis]